MPSETDEDFLTRTGATPHPGDTAAVPPPASSVPGDDASFLTHTGAAQPSLPAWATAGAPGPAVPAQGLPPQPQSNVWNDPGGTASRIGQSVQEGWQGGPDPSNLLNWKARAAATIFDAGNALLRGGQQTAEETGKAVGLPGLGRDVAAFPEALQGDAAYLSRVRIGDIAPEVMNTSSAVRAVEDRLFTAARKSSGEVSADYVNRGVDSVMPTGEEAAAKAQIQGSNVVNAAVDRLQTFKDKPMTINAWIGLDKGLTADIDAERDNVTGRLSDAGRELQSMQQTLRDHFENPDLTDITNGNPEGFVTLRDARLASQQRFKMEAIERMQSKAADKTGPPVTSLKTQISSFGNNKANLAGWDDDEIAALKDAGRTGFTGGLIHLLGSKLPAAVAGGIAGAAEATGHGTGTGLLAPVIATGMGYGMSFPFRWSENMLAAQKIRNAMDVIGSKVPTNPLGYPEP